MERITTVSSTIPEDQRPSVYWMWGDVFGTAGIDSTADDLITAAGGVNAISAWDDATKTTEHPVLTMESIAKLDPELIYLWFNPEIDPADIIAGRQVGGVDFSTWASLSAVKNGRVFELDDPFRRLVPGLRPGVPTDGRPPSARRAIGRNAPAWLADGCRRRDRDLAHPRVRVLDAARQLRALGRRRLRRHLVPDRRHPGVRDG